MAIGAIWDEIWNEAVWNTAIWSQAAADDTTPDQFTFTDQSGVAVSSTITSAPITVTGIDAAADISVTGGTYSINGGHSRRSPAQSTLAIRYERGTRVRRTISPQLTLL